MQSHKRIPQPLPIQWDMKGLATAVTSFEELSDKRLKLTIDHDTIHGVSPEMLAWWFASIDGTMEYEGATFNRYRLWHPVDHILYANVRLASDGGAGQGSYRNIVEAFGANPYRETGFQ